MAWFQKKGKKKEGSSELKTVETKESCEEERIRKAPDHGSKESLSNDLLSVGSTEHERDEKKTFFNKLKRGLTKTRQILTTDIDELFSGNRKIDDALFEELEELLITSDIGVETSINLIEKLSGRAKGVSSPTELKEILKSEIVTLLKRDTSTIDNAQVKPHVIMVVGVNGVGKTTTIGKLAAKYTAQGKKVIIAAADTFRVAAVEQLAVWSDRAGATLIRHRDNADPAAVAYDSVEAAIARNVDIVLIDTAGRLHTKVNLMEELKKIKRSVAKKLPGAPHDTMIVLDATTGQNALNQAEVFNKATKLTSMALTKLDGTAKGGVVIGLNSSLDIPLKYIGVGEQIDDLQEFDPVDFVNALFLNG